MVDKDIQGSVEAILPQLTERPELGLILGSGLSDLADVVDNALVVETSDLPGYPQGTVQGHQGRLVFGRLENVPIVFVQGRLHMYEGHSLASATFPVRLLSALGVSRLIVTNAAGGIRSSFAPGTLMWITDHINMAFRGPHVHQMPNRRAHPYDLDWTKRAQAIAKENGVQTEEGTYLWTLGPSYETRAEIRMFAGMGADAVGMSTVPEVLEAARRDMNVLGLSTITNHAAGLGHESLHHEEVLEVGRQVKAQLQRLIRALVRDIDSHRI